MSLLSHLVPCVLALALVEPQAPPPRAPGQADRPEPIRQTPLAGAQKEIDRQKKLVEGLWRMVERRDTKMPPGDRKDLAYCMIAGDYLSLELHMDYVGDRQLIEKRLFESGMYQYEILEANRIEMKSLISAFLDEQDVLRFRTSAYIRRYRLDIDTDRMTWIRDDGQRTIFERVQSPGTPPRRDIYGRLIPEKPAAEKPGAEEKAPPRD